MMTIKYKFTSWHNQDHPVPVCLPLLVDKILTITQWMTWPWICLCHSLFNPNTITLFSIVFDCAFSICFVKLSPSVSMPSCNDGPHSLKNIPSPSRHQWTMELVHIFIMGSSLPGYSIKWGLEFELPIWFILPPSSLAKTSLNIIANLNHLICPNLGQHSIPFLIKIRKCLHWGCLCSFSSTGQPSLGALVLINQLCTKLYVWVYIILRIQNVLNTILYAC